MFYLLLIFGFGVPWSRGVVSSPRMREAGSLTGFVLCVDKTGR